MGEAATFPLPVQSPEWRAALRPVQSPEWRAALRRREAAPRAPAGSLKREIDDAEQYRRDKAALFGWRSMLAGPKTAIDVRLRLEEDFEAFLECASRESRRGAADPAGRGKGGDEPEAA